jgi:hypothetical protein
MPIESRSDKYASIVREMIRHENELINHRITWLCQIQGLLFAALGVSFTNDLCDKALLIQPILIFIGITVSISSAIGLIMAGLAIRELKKKFAIRYPNNRSPPIIGLDLGEKKKDKFILLYILKWLFWSFWEILLPWRILPILFISAWIGVAYFLKNNNLPEIPLGYVYNHLHNIYYYYHDYIKITFLFL